MFSKSKVLSLFDARFDHVSSRIVLGDALAKAGLAAGKDSLDGEDLRSLAASLTSLGLPRVDALVAALQDLAGSTHGGRSKAAPAPDPETAPEADAEPADDAGTVEDVGTAGDVTPNEAPKSRPAKAKKR